MKYPIDIARDEIQIPILINIPSLSKIPNDIRIRAILGGILLKGKGIKETKASINIKHPSKRWPIVWAKNSQRGRIYFSDRTNQGRTLSTKDSKFRLSTFCCIMNLGKIGIVTPKSICKPTNKMIMAAIKDTMGSKAKILSINNKPPKERPLNCSMR